MNSQGFRSQSFDAETRARLRLVTSQPSAGVLRAKQEAELRRRVEDWRVKRRGPNWGAITGAAIVVVYLTAFVACAAYVLWYGWR